MNMVPLDQYKRNAGSSLAVVNATELAGKPIPDREWLVDGLIPAKAPTILGGDGGTGKSLLALQLAVAGATGGYWIGHSICEGTCIYVSAEDPLDEMHRRLVDITKAVGRGIADLAKLTILPLSGEDALLAATAGTKLNVLQPTKLFIALEGLIALHKPMLLVLDTLADFFGGQENDRSQARQFIGMLRGLCQRHDVTILLLNHPSLSGMASGSGSSGSTAWNNSVRSRLYFERVKSEDGREEDSDVRVLRTMKANYGPVGEEIKLHWQAGVFKRMGSADSSFSNIAKQSKADRLFLDLLRAYTQEGRTVTATTGHGYAPSLFAKDARAEGIRRDGFVAAMNRLFASSVIRSEEYGPPSRRHNRIVLSPSVATERD